ncbi:MAG: hypothetical protein JW776_09510 [Candidatus Lokiarchaeota archaeon]|nr:hypothetical protein [Candidatus Lokiarchaeota archaeon]
MKEQLQKHLKDGEPWEKMITDIPGVFIVRVPGPKTNPKNARLMLEINPVDEDGKPKKRKGLFLSDRETYIQYFELLSDDRINKILLTLEEVNPKNQSKSMKKLKIE